MRDGLSRDGIEKTKQMQELYLKMDDIFSSMSNEDKLYMNEFHNYNGSISHSIHYGLNGTEELLEENQHERDVSHMNHSDHLNTDYHDDLEDIQFISFVTGVEVDELNQYADVVKEKTLHGSDGEVDKRYNFMLDKMHGEGLSSDIQENIIDLGVERANKELSRSAGNELEVKAKSNQIER